MDRKLHLMKKRAKLGFLKREKERIKYYGIEGCTSPKIVSRN
jgi:hypothetical protein